ncbi:MAG TPA: hypothetical protein VK475_12140 [Pyrinomonadaceae bacterium]|nr:hypothetical protein [Pyrinomonadaceae bacterium]
MRIIRVASWIVLSEPKLDPRTHTKNPNGSEKRISLDLSLE